MMKNGLYHHDQARDSCGFGLVTQVQGEESHRLLQTAIGSMINMSHRGGINADGGTGAAPQSLMDYVGLPLRRSLPLVVDKLDEYGLRQRIKVVCSGKLINPDGVAWALCMGANFVSSARGFMFALGCIQALQCNRNTCPTGITTHNLRLQKGLNPENKAGRVANYARNMAHEVGIIAHSCGVTEPRLLQRKHAHIIMPDGKSTALDELFPPVDTRPEYRRAS